MAQILECTLLILPDCSFVSSVSLVSHTCRFPPDLPSKRHKDKKNTYLYQLLRPELGSYFNSSFFPFFDEIQLSNSVKQSPKPLSSDVFSPFGKLYFQIVCHY